jgi:hypothetical protein
VTFWGKVCGCQDIHSGALGNGKCGTLTEPTHFLLRQVDFFLSHSSFSRPSDRLIRRRDDCKTHLAGIVASAKFQAAQSHQTPPHFFASAPPKNNSPTLRAANNPSPITLPRELQFNSHIGSRSLKFCLPQNAARELARMTADGLEVLLEGLIPEIAYSGEKGESNPNSAPRPFAYLSRAGANPCANRRGYI